MIILPIYPLEDVAQGVYVINGCISIASKYGRDICDNALGKIHQTQHHMKVLFYLYLVRTQNIPLDAVEFQQRYR